MLETVSGIYDAFDQMNVSVWTLFALTVIFLTAFLFAAREAAAWFFKIEDVKRDVRRLHELTLDLEGEIRSLHEVLAAGRAALELPPETMMPAVPAPEATGTAGTKAPSSAFPIVH